MNHLGAFYTNRMKPPDLDAAPHWWELAAAGAGMPAPRPASPHCEPNCNRPIAKTPATPKRARAFEVIAYLAFSRISTSRQRLVADSGRVSIRDTRSPMPAMPFSSCALTFVVVRMILP